MKRLPIGTQTFEILREDDCVYVDKTPYIYRLLQEGRVYFLSRPRRFGKSLLLSTIAALFKGRRELFKDLWIDSSDYDWKVHPVLRFDMAALGRTDAAGLHQGLMSLIKKQAQPNSITEEGLASAFTQLIEQTAKNGKAVVLIDEYDKPIIDHVDNVEAADANRQILRDFYGVLKSQDEFLRFVLLTGVSKFSKVSVFSGLNQLNDITMDRRYASMLGYTQAELEANFKEHIEALMQEQGTDRQATLENIKHWYNGYRLSADPITVYNPFSTLCLFDKLQFSNYWFETGTPLFLLKLIEKQDVDLEQIGKDAVGEAAFSSYEIETLEALPLLYQTGYLTVSDYIADEGFVLDYPNFEVKRSFIESLLQHIAKSRQGLTGGYVIKLVKTLRQNDFELFFETLNLLFANVPYELHIKAERYYQTIFYLIFTLMGVNVTAEARTSRGRIDAVVELDNGIFLFEFKLDGTPKEALAQIHAKRYYDKYQGADKPITLIGAAFDTTTRDVQLWEREPLSS